MRIDLQGLSLRCVVAIAKFIGQMKKGLIVKSGLDAMPLFLLDDLLNRTQKLKNLPEQISS